MLKENDVKEFLEGHNITYCEKSTVWGVVFPSKTTYLFGAVATALSMQYFTLHFNNDGIAIIGINNVTGKIEQRAFAFVPNSEIRGIQFQKKMMSYELQITTTKGNLVYKVNKSMVGTSWHKENLAYILKRFS